MERRPLGVWDQDYNDCRIKPGCADLDERAFLGADVWGEGWLCLPGFCVGSPSCLAPTLVTSCYSLDSIWCNMVLGKAMQFPTAGNLAWLWSS